VADADTESQRQVDDTADQAPDDPSEQLSTPVPATEHEQVVVAGSQVDIKVNRNDGQVIGQWYEAVQRRSGAELSKEYVEGELSPGFSRGFGG
jgi:hypothetical protein